MKTANLRIPSRLSLVVVALISIGVQNSHGAGYADAVQADGPIAYWRFSDTPPTALNAGSLGAAANGTYRNGATSGAEAPRPPFFLGFEPDNTAAQLDGTNAFVSSVTGLINGPNVTMSGWLRRAGTQRNRTGLFGQDNVIEFGYIDNNTVQAWVDNFTTPINVATPFPNEQWSHVALVLDGTNLRMTAYTNGQVAGTAALPSVNYNFDGNVNDFVIGGDAFGQGVTFNGQLDEVAVFDKALGAAQIAAQYASAFKTNVFAPGDPIVLVNGTNDGDGDAGPPPGNEGVEHAIDRVVQKYLNFLDLGSGFATTPSMGLTVVEYIRFYTANDAEARDPASFVLEGSRNGLNGPWTSIASGPLSLPLGRNREPGTTPINSATQFNQLVGFANTAAYSSYRVTFPTLRDAAAANSMQIGEVELLGSAFTCPVPTVAISAPGPNVQACQEVQICATVNSLCVTQVCFLAGATPLGCATASPWCITLPGAVVAPGIYPVTAVAFDSLGRQTPSAPFIVTVADTAPPTVTCPADIAVRATSPAGATVTYVASATDTCGIRTFACVPPSGSVFPVGTTTVTCTAVDTSGNTATCSFNVAVQNQAPVCVAGLFPESCGLSFGDGNTYAIALDNATACVVLNGSGSSDADNDPLQYFWAVDDQFTLSMDANQEPGGSGGTGTGEGTVTLSGNTLTIDVTFSGLSANGSAAHIHGPATRGVNAAVLYSLASLTTLGTTAGTISGTVTLVAGTGGFTIEQQLQQLRAGLWYINIHTPLHADGEIRGQIDPGVPSGPMVRTCLALGCHSVVLGVSDGIALSQCSLDLCVITACEAVEQCIVLVENATIARKNKRPLIASLKAACASFDRGDFVPGINQLGAFQNKVRAQVAPANPDEARAFITCVQRILTAIDCAVQQGNGVDGPGDQ